PTTTGSASPGTVVLWLRRGKVLPAPSRTSTTFQEEDRGARLSVQSFEGSLSRPRHPRGEEQRQSARVLLWQLLSEPKSLF
ncbi:unnamed protein product, partial [Symbiodinium sp. CCMP2456]